MDPFRFGVGLQIEDHSKPSFGNRGPSIQELESIELADPGHLIRSPRPSTSVKNPETVNKVEMAGPSSCAENTKSPDDLEASRPATPTGRDASFIMPSFFYPSMNRWRVLAACLIYFGNGMNDSAPGALIPYIESWYHIGYAVVSLIWISNAVGFILAAFFADAILARLGRARSLMLSEAILATGTSILAAATPFPATVVAYFVIGFGMALGLAYNNVFCANLANSTVMLGASNGCYGIGGILGPIVATLFVSRGLPWARFFLVAIAIRVACFCFAGWAFWNYEKEPTSLAATARPTVTGQQATTEAPQPAKSHLLAIALRNKVTLLGSLLIFSYQGAEVSESGWFLSYLIDVRGGDPAKVGYVTSGFWAGITLGRFLLTPLAARFGEKRFVYLCSAGVLILQLLAWLVPNVIGDAVSVALLGLLLGPVYPCAQTVFARLLPRAIQVPAIGFISSAGSSGGAVVPFLTGLLAQKVGPFVLHPVCLGFYVVMIACWAAMPQSRKRRE